jgi:hypothetical protein
MKKLLLIMALMTATAMFAQAHPIEEKTRSVDLVHYELADTLPAKKNVPAVKDTTVKKDSVAPARIIAIFINENDVPLLNNLVARGIDAAKGDPINNSQEAQFHNALPGLQNYLLGKAVYVDEWLIGVISKAKKQAGEEILEAMGKKKVYPPADKSKN